MPGIGEVSILEFLYPGEGSVLECVCIKEVPVLERFSFYSGVCYSVGVSEVYVLGS